MTVLASDTFSRANQSGWGTSSGGQVWSSARGAGTYSIVSNEGVNSANGGTFSVARIGSGTATSTEVLVRLKPADTTSDIGCIARYTDNNDFYYGVLVSGTVAIGKDVAGSFTTLTSTSFSYSTANFYWLRFNLSGSTLKLKVWQDGTSEPGSWTVTTTDSSLSSGGYGLGSDATGSTSFDSLTITDAPSISTFTRTITPVTAALKTTTTRTVTHVSVALKTTNTRSVTHASAALKTINTHTVPATAALKTTQARTVPTSAALLQTSKRIVGAQAALKTTPTRSVPDSAALKTTNTRSISAQAAIKTTSTRTVPASAALANIRTVPCTACLASNFVFEPNAMLLVPSGQTTLLVPSGETNLIVPSGQTTLII